ncbi:hypothetical protein SUGI_1497280 [Cryptomeria japonica]|uniref:Uncharacterized protein n=1 Tax=Cryptomeria japonica TaxID=3369 RepID=A0AAD3NU43_CRYJA|nr:hypothetical protein SUGI_1373280 [Cryptomeria japonica]GLJ59072.1 hypothetical protein SUGI_1491320 [Cryptomeria japonica]GLJ59200.1 hypothetical protein SUGI_1497280 [Cryptomeria japonica]
MNWSVGTFGNTGASIVGTLTNPGTLTGTRANVSIFGQSISTESIASCALVEAASGSSYCRNPYDADRGGRIQVVADAVPNPIVYTPTESVASVILGAVRLEPVTVPAKAKASSAIESKQAGAQ